jgi:hypothetical protein
MTLLPSLTIVFIRTHFSMSSLSLGSPIPHFDYYYAAIDKVTGETVAVSESAVGVLAEAAEKTGLPRDCFEVRQISREEYERLKEP